MRCGTRAAHADRASLRRRYLLDQRLPLGLMRTTNSFTGLSVFDPSACAVTPTLPKTPIEALCCKGCAMPKEHAIAGWAGG